MTGVFMNSFVNFRVPLFLEQLGDCQYPKKDFAS
jgi:hypothetical protein